MTACKGTIWQHFAGGFFSTAIAVLIFAFLTRDPGIVFGACVVFGALGWFHPQIYAGIGTSVPQVAAAWTTFRARRPTVEQKMARVRWGVSTVLLPCTFALTMFAGSKIDGVLSPALPIAIWALLLCSYTFLINSEWTSGPFAKMNKQAERMQYERGLIYFIARKVFEIMWIGSVFSVIAVAQAVYYGLTIVLAIITTLAMTFVRLARKLVYLAAKHAECGICVTTGLGLTAWVTSTYVPSSDNPVRAVAIALLAGFFTAAISIVISKGIVIFFECDEDRKRLVTSEIIATYNDEYAPQLVRVFNIGRRFFSGMHRKVRRVLPAEPKMPPLTTRLIPKLIREK